MLAGIAHIGVWLFAPMDGVKLASSLIGLGAFGTAAANWVCQARAGHFGVDQQARGHSA